MKEVWEKEGHLLLLSRADGGTIISLDNILRLRSLLVLCVSFVPKKFHVTFIVLFAFSFSLLFFTSSSVL